MSSAIVVLGSPNDENGGLFPIAISRCERALWEFKRAGACKILCTGGYGQHFNATKNPHGKYLQDYLLSSGVPLESFLEIALSSFTLEDAILSKPILVSNSIQHVILVTSDFHMERAKLVFDHVLPNIKIDCSEAVTLATDDELKKLIQHEVVAIERDSAKLHKLADN